jgi:hypothetical protein
MGVVLDGHGPGNYRRACAVSVTRRTLPGAQSDRPSKA